MRDTTRPNLLTFGIFLTALRAILIAGGGALLGSAAVVGLVIGAAEARGDDGIPFAIAAVVVGLVMICVCLYEVALIAVCAGAWFGIRSCVWALLAASTLGVGLPAPGIIKTPIAVVTLVGCVQWLERPAGARDPDDAAGTAPSAA